MSPLPRLTPSDSKAGSETKLVADTPSQSEIARPVADTQRLEGLAHQARPFLDYFLALDRSVSDKLHISFSPISPQAAQGLRDKVPHQGIDPKLLSEYRQAANQAAEDEIRSLTVATRYDETLLLSRSDLIAMKNDQDARRFGCIASRLLWLGHQAYRKGQAIEREPRQGRIAQVFYTQSGRYLVLAAVYAEQMLDKEAKE